MWVLFFSVLVDICFENMIYSDPSFFSCLWHLLSLFLSLVPSPFLFSSLSLSPPTQIEHVLTVMLTGNFIGIVFCRSLHYQFYSWYFFSIPYLLWRTDLPNVIKLLCMLLIEVAWNQHPPLAWSSVLLQMIHLFILGALWKFKNNRRGKQGLPPIDWDMELWKEMGEGKSARGVKFM